MAIQEFLIREQLACLAHVTHTFSNSVEFLPSIPAGTIIADIYVETGSIRLTEDGVATPTFSGTPVGILYSAGQNFSLTSWTWAQLVATRMSNTQLSVTAAYNPDITAGTLVKFVGTAQLTPLTVSTTSISGSSLLVNFPTGTVLPSPLGTVFYSSLILQLVQIIASDSARCQIVYRGKPVTG